MNVVSHPRPRRHAWLVLATALATANADEPARIVLDSPAPWQVIQRAADNHATVVISGENPVPTGPSSRCEIRITGTDLDAGWNALDVTHFDNRFRATVRLPAGGWYQIAIRIRTGDETLAAGSIQPFGVGEVFVVAGQSNAANHGAERQVSTTNLISAFDGDRWQPANDPQPGASGRGGSFLPPFADTIASRFHVPVGLVPCAVGATSVREWLPEGHTFPNPPTLTGNVVELPDGRWASRGTLFQRFVDRMHQLGPEGFRAVLWHQGESDANQRDATRTLPGPLYEEYLRHLIQTSSEEIGWRPPWFVALVSYHVPGDESSPEIRAAQRALWLDGTALEGPDSDALRSEFRDSNGQGVHFSGPGLREHAARWVERVAPWLSRTLQPHTP